MVNPILQVRTLLRLSKAVTADAPLILPAWLPTKCPELHQPLNCSWAQCVRSIQTRATPQGGSWGHLLASRSQQATHASHQPSPLSLIASIQRVGWPAHQVPLGIHAVPHHHLHTQATHPSYPSLHHHHVQGCVVGSQVSQWQQVRHSGNLSRVRVPKSAAINNTVMSNTTQLKYGAYGIRALTARRVAANTIEAMRRTLRRRLKKSAALWVRVAATVPVTRKPEGIRMGKGKGAIDFYACAVRPGQIICEMDRVPRKVALSALQAVQPKFPCKLGFVEWS